MIPSGALVGAFVSKLYWRKSGYHVLLIFVQGFALAFILMAPHKKSIVCSIGIHSMQNILWSVSYISSINLPSWF